MTKKNNYFLIFLFPLLPVRILKSIMIICILGLLIALSFVLKAFSINIPGIGMSISFTWIPTIIIGWFFGPIIGLFMGALIDTLHWLIFGGFWFWIYAIQEPSIGLLVGMIASIYRLYFENKKRVKFAIIINQIIVFSFTILTLFFIYYYTSEHNPIFGQLVGSGQLPKQMNTIFRYLISSFLILFFIISEILIFVTYFKSKNDNYKNNNLLIFLFISFTSLLITFIFSFLLGPISAIKYYEFIYNKTPPNLLKYGVIYYLLPRIIKECIKTPIYIGLLSAIIYSLNPIFKRVKYLAINTYNYD